MLTFPCGLFFQSPMQLHVRALRKTGPKLSDPTFLAELVIFRVSSSITGTYYCRSIQNPNKFDKVHIFAQGKNHLSISDVFFAKQDVQGRVTLKNVRLLFELCNIMYHRAFLTSVSTFEYG